MKHKIIITIISIAIIFMVGCNKTQSNSTAVEENDTLVIAIGVDLETFDIQNAANTMNEAITDNIFDNLFARNWETNEIENELAEDYKIIDETTWEVTIKEGVHFHNGDEISSKDIKFTLERVGNDESLIGHPTFKELNEVEIVDDYTVRIKTEKPVPQLLNILSHKGAGILPANYIEENGIEHFLNNPVGSGPYKFVEWIRDNKIVFEKNKDYFLGDVTDWNELVFRVIPENSTRVSELLTSGVDIAVNIPPADWDRIESTENVHLARADSGRTLMMFLRSTEGWPTSDKRVRQAIDYAIDNKSITENVLKGAGTPTLTRVAPNAFGHNSDLYDNYNFNPEKAKELLAEAGYKDGLEITLHAPRGRYLQDAEVAETVAGMLAEVGITMNIEFMEWGAYTELRQANKNKDAYLIGLTAPTWDADEALDWYRGDRLTGQIDYVNDEVDSLLLNALTNMDADERQKQYEYLQELIAEDTPHIIFHQETINTGVNDRVDFSPTPDEMLYAPLIKKK